MNISVPAVLKRLVDRAVGSVNWSAVAADAFRAKPQELSESRRSMNMDNVIDRLRVAAELEESEFSNAGKRVGAEWARLRASPRNLRLLDAALDLNLSTSWAFVSAHNGVELGNVGAGVALYHAVIGRKAGGPAEAERYWSRALGPDAAGRLMDTSDSRFASGFVDGALEVCLDVGDKL
jgi:hypothetical protein